MGHKEFFGVLFLNNSKSYCDWTYPVQVLQRKRCKSFKVLVVRIPRRNTRLPQFINKCNFLINAFPIRELTYYGLWTQDFLNEMWKKLAQTTWCYNLVSLYYPKMEITFCLCKVIPWLCLERIHSFMSFHKAATAVYCLLSQKQQHISAGNNYFCM